MSNRRLKIKEMAELAGLSEYAIRRMCKEGQVPYISVGRRIFIDPESFEQALKIQEQENQARQLEAMQAHKPTEVIHYGKLKDLIKVGE